VTKTALVTGATGFIGTHLVRFLLTKGWSVVGTYGALDVTPPNRLPNLQLVQCDLRDCLRVKQLFDKSTFSHVFHLGAQSLPVLSWKDPVSTFESNIMGSLNLFEAIRPIRCPPVVVSACSGAEYGDVPRAATPVTENHRLSPVHPYGISKMCVDRLAQVYSRNYHIPTVTIRLFNTTGPGKTNDAPSDFVRQLIRIKKGLQEPAIEVGNLKPRRAFLDVNDAVSGFYLAALRAKRGQVYNLCADKTYQIAQVLRAAIDLSSVAVRIQPSSRLMRALDEKIIFGSTRKFRRDTGWKPRKTLDQTLAAMFEYWERVA
jgi:GDP-4-dehydro-6-deoxy-D-mannose reductase